MEVGFEKTNPRLAYKQVPIWLLAVLEAVHAPVDEVAIGYLKGNSADLAPLNLAAAQVALKRLEAMTPKREGRSR